MNNNDKNTWAAKYYATNEYIDIETGELLTTYNKEYYQKIKTEKKTEYDGNNTYHITYTTTVKKRNCVQLKLFP